MNIYIYMQRMNIFACIYIYIYITPFMCNCLTEAAIIAGLCILHLTEPLSHVADLSWVGKALQPYFLLSLSTSFKRDGISKSSGCTKHTLDKRVKRGGKGRDGDEAPHGKSMTIHETLHCTRCTRHMETQGNIDNIKEIPKAAIHLQTSTPDNT